MASSSSDEPAVNRLAEPTILDELRISGIEEPLTAEELIEISVFGCEHTTTPSTSTVGTAGTTTAGTVGTAGTTTAGTVGTAGTTTAGTVGTTTVGTAGTTTVAPVTG